MSDRASHEPSAASPRQRLLSRSQNTYACAGNKGFRVLGHAHMSDRTSHEPGAASPRQRLLYRSQNRYTYAGRAHMSDRV